MFRDVQSGFSGRIAEIGWGLAEALGIEAVEEREGSLAASHLLAAKGRAAKPGFFEPMTLDALDGHAQVDGYRARDLMRHIAGRPDDIRRIEALDVSTAPFDDDTGSPLPPGRERSLRLGEALADVTLGLASHPAIGFVGPSTFVGGATDDVGYFGLTVGQAIARLVRIAGIDPLAVPSRLGCPDDVARIVIGPDGEDLAGLGALVVALVERRLGAPFEGLSLFDEDTESRAIHLVAAVMLIDPSRDGAFDGLRELLASG